MGTFQDLALNDYTLQDAIYVVDGEPTINDRYVGKTEPDQEGKEEVLGSCTRIMI